MTNGWPNKKITEIAQHSLGKMLDKAKNKGEPQQYLRNLNVRWFEFDLSNLLEMRFLPEEAEKFTAVKGDVLICEGGYPGRAAIWDQDEPVYFQKAIHRVRFYQPEHAKWFLYYLYAQDLDGTLKNHFTGSGIQHFTGKTLARFEIPLPPLPEQRRIVAILDEAFAGIATARANAERNLRNARGLFESHLEGVFSRRGEGWVERPFEKLIESNLIGLTRSRREQGPDRTWKYLKMNNITRDGRLDLSGVVTVDANDEERQKFYLQRNDFLFNTRNSFELVGKCCLYENNSNEIVLYNNNIMRVRFARSVNPRFVLFAFLSSRVNGELNALKSGTTNVSAIYYKDLRSLQIPIAPLDVQDTIASQLDALREQTQNLQTLYQRKLAALDELKKSLLDRAFSGRL